MCEEKPRLIASTVQVTLIHTVQREREGGWNAANSSMGTA